MDEETQEFLRVLFAHDDRQRLVAAAYQKVDRKQLKQLLLVDIRCKSRGCLLLHVWRAPLGVCFYKPPHKLSTRRNQAASNESGRKANTVDGDNHWRGYGGVLDDLRGWGPQCSMPVQCDHVDRALPAEDLLDLADNAAPGRPATLRIQGSDPIPAASC